MQKRFFITENGQSVQTDDADLLGETSALADDRVFAELFRLAPYAGSVAKAILAHGHQGSGVYGLVAPGAALGEVDVRPFRAIIGSRAVEAAGAMENWQDARSALSVIEGATTRITSITVGANATAFARIDLVYAAFALEDDGPTVDRKKKDPTTGVVTDLAVPVTKVSSVTSAIVQGTASATPATPTTPSDSGNLYIIPLAYVRVPAGFGATSSLVLRRDFHVVAPVITLSPAVGAASLRSANKGFAASATPMAAWANTSSSRAVSYLPSDLVGSETVAMVLDLTSGAESHANGDVVDSSRDWRNRITSYRGVASEGAIPWLSTTPGLLNPELCNRTSNNSFFDGMGHTFVGTTATDRVAAYVQAAEVTDMTASGHVKLYVDDSTGFLKVSYSTGPTHPNTKLVVLLTFTGPL